MSVVRIGFLEGEASIPDDLDVRDVDDIEQLFAGPVAVVNGVVS
jgi:hypothetical protein